MYDLSIVIPARNEEWLSATVENILENKRGKTEVIVLCDGNWPDPPIQDHDDVKLIYVPESIGQRAGQNMAVRLSTAKYVAKTDAHVAFSEGFDVELINTFKELGDNITVAPLMKNLQAFEWKCMKCGNKWYQGPTPIQCQMSNSDGNKPDHANPNCNNTTDFTKKKVFKPRPNTPNSTSYRFDSDLHFQYFGEWKEKQVGDYVESMSLQGSFFMCTRENYWKLNLCDETWGSWGQQGSEVAIKTWLSGGRVIINKKCWYAHLFRTQPGFSFPYQQSGKAQQRARDICNDVFKNNKWEHQKYPLSWLVEKFWPVPGWTQDQLDELKRVPLKQSVATPIKDDPEKGILYFTDNNLTLKIARPVQQRLREIAEETGMELVSSSRKPMDKMGVNVVVDEPAGYHTMFKQILAGLKAMKSDIVFLAEHDVLYPVEHFRFTPIETDKVYYDHSWIKVHPDGTAYSWEADQVSGLCAFRDVLIDYYQNIVDTYDEETFNRRFEPYSRTDKAVAWYSNTPYIDIRHGSNLTGEKRSLDDFRDKSTAKGFVATTIADVLEEDIISSMMK